VLQFKERTRTQDRGLRGRPPAEDVAEESTVGAAGAAGALASSAVIAEGVQLAGTAVLFYLGQQATGTSSPVEAVGAMIDYLQDLGPSGYGVFAATMIFLQVRLRPSRARPRRRSHTQQENTCRLCVAAGLWRVAAHA
jgi:hypothetical protein